ncbi:hypothetical protein Q8F55_008288 [Vanrija albida]|uniref:Uncharacterized protein n=1 Tax=Vanrija albida TaxID=181172 RepID=A0ABR3PWR8_9TREE
MFTSALLMVALSAVAVAQSSSPTPASQTSSPKPSASTLPYPGVQVNKPGFQILYPKNGSYSFSPKSEKPATNKTWPANWYWNDFSTDPMTLADSGDGVAPGSGYYVELTSYNLSITYAVSELFELKETKTADPSLPPGPYGRVSAGASRPIKLSMGLVCLSGTVALWVLL